MELKELLTLYPQAIAEVASLKKHNEALERKLHDLIAWRVGAIEAMRAKADEWKAESEGFLKGSNEAGVYRRCSEDIRAIANSAAYAPESRHETAAAPG